MQRFRSEFTALPPMRHWGERYQEDPVAAKTELVAMIRVMAAELFTVGVNLTWAPVLDVDHGVSEIIGNRSFSADPLVVTNLARVVIDTLHECGMPATGKHFPGHGAVKADSHTELPVDHRPWNEIAQTDLEPFAALVDSLDAIMPAHIVYSELDNLPAGFSSYWLQTVLRKQLGFTGVIVSDDLTMAGAAMAGSYSDRAALALEAGCDLLPVCNNRAGAIEVLHSLEKYKNMESAQRVNDFLQRLKPC